MSGVIHHEILFFLVSVLAGILIFCAYDQVRVLRRIIPHNGFFRSLEDFFFWTSAGIFCFGVAFKANSGSLRGFSMAAIVFGMWFYHETVSPWIVKSEVFVFRTVLFPVLFLSKKIREIQQKTLKKIKKWIRMKRNESKQSGRERNRGSHERTKKKARKQPRGNL